MGDRIAGGEEEGKEGEGGGGGGGVGESTGEYYYPSWSGARDDAARDNATVSVPRLALGLIKDSSHIEDESVGAEPLPQAIARDRTHPRGGGE